MILMANYNRMRNPKAKIGHVNHPVTKYYTVESNEIELCAYLKQLLNEYKVRFEKEHQNQFWFCGFMLCNTYNLYSVQEFSSSKTYVNGTMTDNIEEIRRYISAKPHSKPYTWTNREKPDWWEV